MYHFYHITLKYTSAYPVTLIQMEKKFFSTDITIFLASKTIAIYIAYVIFLIIETLF